MSMRRGHWPCLAYLIGTALLTLPVDVSCMRFESVGGETDLLPRERRRYLTTTTTRQLRRGRAQLDFNSPEDFPSIVPSTRDDDVNLIQEEPFGIVDIENANDASQRKVEHDSERKLHLALDLDLDLDLPPCQSSSLSPSFSKKFRSTGTTIVGCLVQRGKYVLLGADTRATDQTMVADKRCAKIHTLSRNVYACGAGTAADLDALTRYTRYSMALETLTEESIGNGEKESSSQTSTSLLTDSTEQGGICLSRPARVSAVCRFLRNALYEGNGNLGVNLIVGGYDCTQKSQDPCGGGGGGGRLVAIHPHGSMDVVPYAALGSGGLAAMSVLEARYRPSMTLKEGIALVRDAVSAGIENDLGSGSQVDLCVLGPDGMVEYTRALVAEERLEELGKGEEEDAVSGESLATGRMIVTTPTSAIDGTETLVKGVNGFGNVPFSVQSRRVVAAVQDDATLEKAWGDFIGFT